MIDDVFWFPAGFGAFFLVLLIGCLGFEKRCAKVSNELELALFLKICFVYVMCPLSTDFLVHHLHFLNICQDNGWLCSCLHNVFIGLTWVLESFLVSLVCCR